MKAEQNQRINNSNGRLRFSASRNELLIQGLMLAEDLDANERDALELSWMLCAEIV